MNEASLKEGVDFYWDDSGLMVFTAIYHLKKGYCCGNGCRNCPYHYVNVRNPLKKRRLQENKPRTSS